jgi:hypothetical protein
MIKQYKASIKFDTLNNHPDNKNAKGLYFSDTYSIDHDYFYGYDDIIQYIKHDIKLVAGGGYKTNTIDNIIIDIARI